MNRRNQSSQPSYRQEDARRHGHLQSNARQEEMHQRDLRQNSHGLARGRGPKNWVRSDERILEDLSEQLAEDSWVDASDIEVAVKNSEVTLKGTVQSKEEKRRADNIAENIVGVTQVRNELRIA